MAKFQFDLVGPEKLLYSGEVEQVDVPGSEGDFGVLAGHAPLIAMLRPGVLTIYTGTETIRALVTGGFAEANPTGLTVLADSAVPVDGLDRAMLAQQVKDLEESLAGIADGPARDRAAHRLDQLRAAQAALAN